MTLSLRVSRCSVCAGDDIDSHDIVLAVAPEETLGSVVARLRTARYLPSIAGDQATWIIQAGGKALAVVAQAWRQPRFLGEAEGQAVAALAEDGVHFRYWCQVDPDRVYACLRDGLPLPDRYGR